MSPYYFVGTKDYAESRPSPKQNLLELYGLSPLALSVARTNPDGSKGVKLRKSYKSHIADLPGKHSKLNTDRDLSPIVYGIAALMNGATGPVDPATVPEPPAKDTKIVPLEMDYLLDKLKFDRSPDSGIPGFDSANLAVSDSSVDDEGKKRKKKNQGGEDAKRQKV